MREYIALDSHKHYTWAEREDVQTCQVRQCRVGHERGAIRRYLGGCEPGTPVAVEATANWYWIVEEIEQAGLKPLLVHPGKAKLMMGLVNKSDKLDAHGLNRLQRTGTLPTVWIPPADLRDLRELTRTRAVIGSQRTRLKNRITATLAKYGLQVSGYSDPYGRKAREELNRRVGELPPQTRHVTGMLLKHLDFVQRQIEELEERLKKLVRVTSQMQWLMSLPGVGLILSAVIWLELGDVRRFASAERLASYAGTTPRVHASGDKVRYGPLRPDVNHFLRWALVEAANSVAVNAERCADRHVSQLYRRLRIRRDHSKAIGAVARHLAEAAWHVLNRREPYRDPALNRRPLREVQAR